MISLVLRFGPATAAPAGGRPGGGLLVNVSRGISSVAVRADKGAAKGAAASVSDGSGAPADGIGVGAAASKDLA